MSSEVVIRVENLSKKYTLGKSGLDSGLLRHVLHDYATAPFRWLGRRNGNKPLPGESPQSAICNPQSVGEFYALKDVTFEVKRGEVIGIIGRNGAGKSTLLKILSRITEPTTGRVGIKGRVASLLEVGTGFHPELTGRENIYLNGSILGMTKAEIKKKFDLIVAFAEVERFLDTPVKRYSSGMYVRLAFAVAAHLEPEILMVDEVLAVGDAQFQSKCLGKMGEVAKQGRTVLFVSHNMGAISNLTKTCVYLKSGHLEMFDITPATIRRYFDDTMYAKSLGPQSVDFFRREKRHDSAVEITSIGLVGGGRELPELKMLSDISIQIGLRVHFPVSGANVMVRIRDADMTNVAVVFSWDSSFNFSASPGQSMVMVHIPKAPFTPGRFFCDVGVNQSTATKAFDVIIDFPLFEIRNDGQVVHWIDRPWGTVHLSEVKWEMSRQVESNGWPGRGVEGFGGYLKVPGE